MKFKSKLQQASFCEIMQISLKVFLQKCKYAKDSEDILEKKNKVGKTAQPDIKIYYKATNLDCNLCATDNEK